MKNFLLLVCLIGVIAWLIASYPEISKKMKIQDCYESKRICTQYWDVHGGNCFECKEMNRCENEGLI